MSYDIYLSDPLSGETLELPFEHHLKGGTYALGGTTLAELNVTYNYARHYRGFGPKGIREIYGMTGAQSLQPLITVAESLGRDTSEDYWEPTEGNARQALIDLLSLARMLPHGIWRGN
jgi:hypothetical protein